jgi:histone H3
VNWLYDIRNAQKQAALCIPRLSFARLVREIAGGFHRDLRFQSVALAALQHSAESMLATWFSMLFSNSRYETANI